MDSFDSFDSFDSGRQDGGATGGRSRRWRRIFRFLRQAFIVVGILIFLLYVRASVVYQNQIDVPNYRTVSVNILGNRSRQEWDADPGSQFAQLMRLENQRFQLPPGVEVTVPGRGGQDVVLTSDRSLTSEDFTALIAKAPPGAGLVMELRDTSAINSLVSHGYILRDAIYDPEHPHEAPLIDSAEPVNKALIDRLHELGVPVITITGHGSAVDVDYGTMIMVFIIFLCLVAALKPILWDPFQIMLDKRQKELAIGAEATRHNQTESAKLESERVQRNANLMRDIQGKRMAGQQRTAKEVDAVIQAARDEEKAARMSGFQEVGAAVRSAEEGVQSDIPKLADAIAGAVLGRDVEK